MTIFDNETTDILQHQQNRIVTENKIESKGYFCELPLMFHMDKDDDCDHCDDDD